MPSPTPPTPPRTPTPPLPLRIGVLVESFPELSETFVVQLVVGLLELGHDVRIVALRAGDGVHVTPEVAEHALLDRTVALGIPAGRRERALSAPRAMASRLRRRRPVRDLVDPRRGGRSLLSLRALHAAAALDARPEPLPRFDVIHAHFGKNGLLATQLADVGVLDAPLVVTFHGNDVTAYPRELGDDVYAPLFRRAAAVTGVSRFVVDRLVGLGAPPAQLHRIPMPFAADRFVGRPPQPERPGPVRLVSVGRLVDKKGFDDLLDAVARLRDDEVDVALRIVGDGPRRDHLARRIVELDLAGRVELLGALGPDDLAAQMSAADLFVLASVTAPNGDHEGLGVVLQEAQAIGLPVVATRHDGFPDAVVEGESALLVDEHAPDQLAAAIAELAADRDRWSAMAAAGGRHVRDTFDRTTVATAFDQLLREVVATPPNGHP